MVKVVAGSAGVVVCMCVVVVVSVSKPMLKLDGVKAQPSERFSDLRAASATDLKA